MIRREISPFIESLALKRNKMAFISGPRQCGKTTLAKDLLLDKSFYFNWDQLKFRQLWIKSPELLAEQSLAAMAPRIVLDELHKSRNWKRELKGFYDEFGEQIQILVTGSSKLDTYRKGGDSLLGRFYHFHLHPLSLSELLSSKKISFKELEHLILSIKGWPEAKAKTEVESLFRFGGFPEPLLSDREDIHSLWQKTRIDLLIKQDLRDLSQVHELSKVEILAALLPLKVGSPLSTESLRKDLEVAFTTTQKWLLLLKTLFYHFELKPYSKSISRSLKKEGKIYLYDWSSIESPGARFENMVASHLLKFCHSISDTGTAEMELFYLRDKEKREIDFLLVKNKKPWITVEAKIHDLTLDKSFQVFQKKLGVPHFQIVMPSKIDRFLKMETGNVRIISFDTFFSVL